MNAMELEQLMEEYNRKLDEIIHLNKNNTFKNLPFRKSRQTTNSLLFYRITEVAFWGLVVVFMGSFVAFHLKEIHLAVSGLIIELFALIALTGSIGQIVLIRQIDYSKPVVEIRKKIESVNAHGLLFIKLLMISLPVWWVYAIVGLYLLFGIDIYPYLNPKFVTVYLTMNGVLVIPLIWFLNKLSYENLHIKWVQKTINGLTSPRTRMALHFLKEIEVFEK